MSKTRRSAKTAADIRREYTFDYDKSRPNRFAPRPGDHVVAVVLEPDVARVFDSSASVNHLLRSVISAFPSRTRRTRLRQKAG